MAWSNVHLISTGNYNILYGKPTIVRGIDGKLHIIWYDALKEYVYYSFSTDNGVTWAAIETVESTPQQKIGTPSIAVDSNGSVHVVYQAKNFGTYPAQWDLYYKYRNPPPGGGWSGRTPLTDTNGPDGYTPSIAVDSQGNLHVVWWCQTGTPAQTIKYVKKTSSGWSSTTTIGSKESFLRQNPCLYVDTQDRIHVVYTGTGEGSYTDKFQIIYKLYSGGWSAKEVLTNLNNHQSYPRLSVDGSNNPYVVWEGGLLAGPSGRDVGLREKSTGSWGSIFSVTGGFGVAGDIQADPSIAFDKADNVHVVWWRTRVGVDDMAYWRGKISGAWVPVDEIEEILGVKSTFPRLVDRAVSRGGGRPRNLLCEQKTNPTDVTDPQPEFSALYSFSTAGAGRPAEGCALAVLDDTDVWFASRNLSW